MEERFSPFEELFLIVNNLYSNIDDPEYTDRCSIKSIADTLRTYISCITR